MRFDQVSPPLSEYPQRGVVVAVIETCDPCAGGHPPIKLKRQWVHHFKSTGRVIVCTAHDLKPGS